MSFFLVVLESQRYKKLSRDEYNKVWLVYGIAGVVLFVSAGILSPISLILFAYGSFVHGVKGQEYAGKAKQAEKREQSLAASDRLRSPSAPAERVSMTKESKGIGDGKAEPQSNTVKSALENRLEEIDSLKKRGLISEQECLKMRNKALGLD